MATKASETEAAKATEVVEYNGFHFPKRISSQDVLDALVPEMKSDEYEAFEALLKERRWTGEELDERVRPLRK